MVRRQGISRFCEVTSGEALLMNADHSLDVPNLTVWGKMPMTRKPDVSSQAPSTKVHTGADRAGGETHPVDEVSTDGNLSNMMTARSRSILGIRLLGKKSVILMLGGEDTVPH